MSTPNEQTAPAEAASVFIDLTPILVETAPGQFARMTRADLERIRVCGHEAAHAVITYRVGWRIGTFGVQIGRHGEPRTSAFSNFVMAAGSLPTDRRGMIALRIAGYLYEALCEGRRIGDDGLREALAEARAALPRQSDASPMSDHPAVFADLLAGREEADDDTLLAAYREAEAEVHDLMREPATARSIAVVASALFEHGQLSAEMVELLIEPEALNAAPAFALTVQETFRTDLPVFMSFSGGKESVVLAHLCEPWRDRVTLLWVNTGHMAPHMVEFVRSYRDRGWKLLELAPAQDLFTHWQEHGVPTDVTSASHLIGREGQTYQLWPTCCLQNRQMPSTVFLAERGPCIALSGQRRKDQAATPQGLASLLPDHVNVMMPLWEWDEARVLAYVEEHGLTLPVQYGQGYTGSIECLCCPAGATPERMRYLDHHHPEKAAGIRTVLSRALAGAERRIAEVRNAAGI